MSKPICKDCTKRKVGCHSTCAEYIVNKVIQHYKHQKRIEEYDLTYNHHQYNKNCQKLTRQLNRY